MSAASVTALLEYFHQALGAAKATASAQGIPAMTEGPDFAAVYPVLPELVPPSAPWCR